MPNAQTSYAPPKPKKKSSGLIKTGALLGLGTLAGYAYAHHKSKASRSSEDVQDGGAKRKAPAAPAPKKKPAASAKPKLPRKRPAANK
jgi:uncharacterized membrane protein YebE (DUF533 family)